MPSLPEEVPEKEVAEKEKATGLTEVAEKESSVEVSPVVLGYKPKHLLSNGEMQMHLTGDSLSTDVYLCFFFLKITYITLDYR